MIAPTFLPRLHWRSSDRRRPQTLPATCPGHTSGHDSVDPQPIVVGTWPHQHPAVACRGCRAVLVASGLAVADRRTR